MYIRGMTKAKLIDVMGHTYRLVIRSPWDGSDVDGLCESPYEYQRDFPTITISSDLSGRALMETLIHEVVHASAYRMLSEEFVTGLAKCLSVLLENAGFREQREDGVE